MIDPKTQKGADTKERIINAAAQVFYRKGYYGGSISDITREAGVANGTFYIYFDSKLDVYKHLLVVYGKRTRANSSIAIKNAPNRREAERLGIRGFFEFVLEDRTIFNIVWEALYIDKNLFNSYYSTFSESYVRQLKRAQKDGEVIDVDPKVLSYVLMGIINFVALNSIVLENEKDIDYLTDEVMKVLDHGMFKQ